VKDGKALSSTAKIPEKVKPVYRKRTMYGDHESESFPVKVHRTFALDGMLMEYRKVAVSIRSAGQRGRLNDHSGCGLDKVAKACEESSSGPAARRRHLNCQGEIPGV